MKHYYPYSSVSYDSRRETRAIMRQKENSKGVNTHMPPCLRILSYRIPNTSLSLFDS